MIRPAINHRKYGAATAQFLSGDRNSAYLTINDTARLVLLLMITRMTDVMTHDP